MEAKPVIVSTKNGSTSWGMTAKVAGVFLVGALLGGGILWMVIGRDAEAPEKVENTASDKAPTPNTSTTSNQPVGTSGTSLAPSGSFTVSKQKAGMVVTIDSVAFGANGGWVVVHEDRSGALGNALGAQRFEEGTWNGTVTLLRGTEAGKKYHAVLYNESGDKMFSLTDDKPMLSGVNGVPVSVAFDVE